MSGKHFALVTEDEARKGAYKSKIEKLDKETFMKLSSLDFTRFPVPDDLLAKSSRNVIKDTTNIPLLTAYCRISFSLGRLKFLGHQLERHNL